MSLINPSRRELIKGFAAMAAMAALPDHAKAFPLLPSGGVAPSSSLPSVPAAAAAWGFNKLTFYDDFTSLSTIDTQNSLQPGFNWYVQQIANTPSDNPAGHIQPASAFSVSGSVLTFTPPAGINGDIATAAYSSSSAPYTPGTLFHPNGWFAEARIMHSDTNPGVSNSFPSFWMIDAQVLANLVIGSPNWNGTIGLSELDMPDQPVSLTHYNDYCWYSRTTQPRNTNFNYTPVIDYSQWHTVGCLVVPPQKNNGVGIYEGYLDGNLLSSTLVNFNTTGISAQAGTGAQNGWSSDLGTSALGFNLFLSTAAQWPLMVDYVQVWQAGTNV